MKHFLSLFISISCLVWTLPATAQMMLPGATAATPAGATPQSNQSGGAKSAKKRSSSDAAAGESASFVAARPPGEETVIGHQFQRNGSSGVIALERPAKTLEMSKLAVVGYQISKPSEACRVEIGGGKISVAPATRFEGLLSYQIQMEACPFSMDILDGAVRVRGKMCEFAAADCKADPSGVWGPSGASIGDAEAKNIERVRGNADKSARAGFRALLQAAHGDKARTKDAAREQASFSSVREEICRDYAREDKHGFCASRITMARATAISAQLHGDAAPAGEGADKPRPPRKPRPKPALPVAIPTASQ